MCLPLWPGLTRFEVVSNIFAFAITAATAFFQPVAGFFIASGGASTCRKASLPWVDFVHSAIWGAAVSSFK